MTDSVKEVLEGCKAELKSCQSVRSRPPSRPHQLCAHRPHPSAVPGTRCPEAPLTSAQQGWDGVPAAQDPCVRLFHHSVVCRSVVGPRSVGPVPLVDLWAAAQILTLVKGLQGQPSFVPLYPHGAVSLRQIPGRQADVLLTRAGYRQIPAPQQAALD